MDGSVYPTTTGAAGAALGPSKRTRPRATWLITLTAVCFLFGGLMAMQVRAIQSVHQQHRQNASDLLSEKMRARQLQVKLEAEGAERRRLENNMKHITAQLDKNHSLSAKEVQQLNSQIKDLQLVAGLTAVSGPGVMLRVTDNPDAAKQGNDNPFLLGIVHDYNLLQIVNELRAAKADAIAVNHTRVTGYTPIRCVGPSIMINWEATAPPFIIEAIGNAQALESALRLPNGIVDNLKNQSGLGVRISRVSHLQLPASPEGAPRLRVAMTSTAP